MQFVMFGALKVKGDSGTWLFMLVCFVLEFAALFLYHHRKRGLAHTSPSSQLADAGFSRFADNPDGEVLDTIELTEDKEEGASWAVDPS